MAIVNRCPHCNHICRFSNESAGKLMPCLFGCGRAFLVGTEINAKDLVKPEPPKVQERNCKLWMGWGRGKLQQWSWDKFWFLVYLALVLWAIIYGMMREPRHGRPDYEDYEPDPRDSERYEP